MAKIIGIIYDENDDDQNDDDFGVWWYDGFENDVEKILMKYITCGTSDRGTAKEMSEEIATTLNELLQNKKRG